MPTISMFFGVIVYLYFNDNERHHEPHIHVRFAEFRASFSIVDGELISGELPKRQTRYVQAWIEIHRDDLLANWQLVTSGDTPFKIKPLK